MKIQVTRQHINSGLVGSCTSDPVALALLDAGFIGPWVSPSGIRFTDEEFGYRHEVPVPDEVLEFMKQFDNGGFIEPFEFEMEE